MHIFKFLSLFGLLCVVSFSAWAQGHSAFCGRVDSTAASQGCLKKHLDSAQKRLNKIYKNLSVDLKGEQLQELQELQATWLTYRDAECMWEKARSVTASLKRINELSCMARVTEDRADLLNIAYAGGGKENVTREYGSFPRWMNALSKDHSHVYWDYGNRRAFDLDCDGDLEHVMQGVITSEVDQDGDISPVYQKDIVLAIVQNPPIGRPSIDVLEFSVGDNTSDNSVCSDKISIEFDQTPIVDEDVSDAEPKKCHAFLKLKSKGCSPKTISWTGKKFALEVEETVEKIQEK